jgi:hypothetical protein
VLIVVRKGDDIDRIERPDIEIGAVVKAKRLRFETSPDTEVRFEGEPGVDHVSGSERENLPETVEPGVTYRDVRVRWRAAAKLDARPKQVPSEGDDDG